jgi:hypothetical protein
VFTRLRPQIIVYCRCILLSAAIGAAGCEDDDTTASTPDGSASGEAGGGDAAAIDAGAADAAAHTGTAGAGQAGASGGAAAGHGGGGTELQEAGEPCLRGFPACAPELVCAQLECFGNNGNTCIEMPEPCDDLAAPVCSCNDESFANACELVSAGQFRAHEGECVVEDGLLKAGTWSAEGAILVASASSAALMLPCAMASVDVPPAISDRTLHSAGRRTATWRGSYGPLGGNLEPAEYVVEMEPYSAELQLEIFTVGAESRGAFTLRYADHHELDTCE